MSDDHDSARLVRVIDMNGFAIAFMVFFLACTQMATCSAIEGLKREVSSVVRVIEYHPVPRCYP